MNDYNINLGVWNSVFAVPSEVVDKYIKLAGAAQLKVLLWILRNTSNAFTVDDIGNALSMHPADVRDSIEFWVTAGLLSKNQNTLMPKKDSYTVVEQAVQTPSTPKPQIEHSEPKHVMPAVPQEKPVTRPLSRPERPDSVFVAQRLVADATLASLMQEAQVILGRPLSHGDSATLLMLHDNDGLPVDVILMILTYAVGEGKGMRYIEKMGINWSSEGIDTLEKADEKIKEITKSKEAWAIASKTFGVKNVGSPSKTQIEYSDRWINKWGYRTDMLRNAYEKCVDTKGEYNLKYIDGIIKKWHSSGIFTIDDLNKAEHNKTSVKGTKQQHDRQSSSYDLEAYENFSIFDKED